MQICADDALTVAHALRMIVKDARSFAKVRWTQRGFRRSAHPGCSGMTQRNLIGQLDGTVNPTDLDRAVWIDQGANLAARRHHAGVAAHPDGAWRMGRGRPGGQDSPSGGGWTPALP